MQPIEKNGNKKTNVYQKAEIKEFKILNRVFGVAFWTLFVAFASLFGPNF